MLIALDYDGTYTEDPAFFNLLLSAAQHCGHTVYIVTMRHESESFDLLPLLNKGVTKLVCTGRQAKVEYCTERGITPDVWIDDSPWFLLNGG